ncbi:MAG: response regulator [Lentisphaerae bacterium]|nr:MAG: response regulator [Lentisphaerota bacterium]
MAKKENLPSLAIYVVSGQASTRLNIKRFLQKKNHEVFSAASGKELINLDKDFLGNLIIADSFLPDMPIVELLTHIRENRRLMKDIADIDFIPSIVVAGNNEKLDEATLKKLGMLARINKPINFNELGEVLNQIIRGELYLEQDDRVSIGILDPEKRAVQYLAKLLESDDVRIHSMYDVFDLRGLLNDGQKLDLLLVETLALTEEPESLFPLIKQANPKADIVVLTAFADEEETATLKKLGVREIMTKPIKPMQIRQLVRKIVAEKLG